MEKTKRKYYVGHSYMGTNYTYDSGCWKVFAFDSAKERAEWLEENEYNGSNYVAEKITKKIAYKILKVTQSKLYYGGHFVNGYAPNEIEFVF